MYGEASASEISETVLMYGETECFGIFWNSLNLIYGLKLKDASNQKFLKRMFRKFLKPFVN